MNNHLAQYYTEDSISKLLVSSMSSINPASLLEIGVGQGSLIKQAQAKWTTAKIIGIEIDERKKLYLKKTFPEANLFFTNGLSSRLKNIINVQYNTIDLAICNPPYLVVDKNREINQIIEAAGLGNIKNYKKITSDIVILGQNLLFLKDGGELGIILPDGPVTSFDFESFRKNISENHTIQTIIELPFKTFLKTEAKTYILIIKKGKIGRGHDYNLELLKSDTKGNVTNRLSVGNTEIIKRMDFSFHSWKQNFNEIGITLKEMNAEICRGSFSKKALFLSGNQFLHTTQINNNSSLILDCHNIDKGIFAKKNDIVMSRVGRNNLGKVTIIKSGKILISDCVFRIRIPSAKYRTAFLKKINSRIGQNWIDAHSHGVCVKIISKADLMNFKI